MHVFCTYLYDTILVVRTYILIGERITGRRRMMAWWFGTFINRDDDDVRRAALSVVVFLFLPLLGA
jgi:hypothetical protein